ncbi:MAG: hypothetical protein V2A61_03230 [Calditrichota bacterium]
MNRFTKVQRFLIALGGMLAFCITPALATVPPVGPNTEPWSLPEGRLQPIHPPQPLHLNPGRDFANYIGHFQRTVQFLDSMQEHDPEAPFFGGLHEGEGRQLWNIVETDNTQEAIRVWCEYAEFFDDLDAYRENIRDAWAYCDSFPAWDEGPDDEFYSLHNCGWGLVAEMGYRRAYNTVDRRPYGLNCANHLVDHTPRIQPQQEDILMPLVAGWAAGTLYQYGQLEDNQRYRDVALRIAADVQAWIDADPDRLFNNENWALCGGTAMWGILNSLGISDSANTADWAAERLERMDVFAGPGQWNCSWNIWYAHAWVAAWQLTGDESYRDNAIAVVDSLLKLDTDRDGGIPATIGDPNDRDQAWVSAYTAWMGLSHLWDELPPINLAITGLIEPSLNRPWPVQEGIPFTFQLENMGSQEEVDFVFEIITPWELEIFDSRIVGWSPLSLRSERALVFREPGRSMVTAYFTRPDDFDHSDDTLRIELDIRPISPVEIAAFNGQGEPLRCLLQFYHEEVESPPSFAEVETDSATGRLDVNLMVGDYQVDVIPTFPYPAQHIDNFSVIENQEARLPLVFRKPDVLLVDGNETSDLSAFYTDELTALGVPYYRWRSETEGTLPGRSSGFHTIIYFTGNLTENTIPPEDQEELASFVEAGGNIFVTGQNIADDLAGSAFLADVLHAWHLTDDTNMPQVDGVPNDIVFNGMSWLLLGGTGANNQDSPAGIRAVNGGVACAGYRNRPDTIAAVRWENENGSRGMFFAFGLEGIHSRIGSSRNDVMRAVLNWLRTPLRIDEGDDLADSPIGYNLITAYPNPANGAVWFTFLPFIGRIQNLDIYSGDGRLVNRLIIPPGQPGLVWDGRAFRGNLTTSGLYFVRIDNQSATRLIILR